MSSWLKLAFGTVIITICSTCAVNNSRQIAGKAVDNFHRQFNESLYTEIYRDADASFRSSGTENDCVGFLSRNKDKLGRVLSSAEIKWQMNFKRLDGVELVTTYNTSFEHGTATETFAWYVNGDSAYLISYNINIPD